MKQYQQHSFMHTHSDEFDASNSGSSGFPGEQYHSSNSSGARNPRDQWQHSGRDDSLRLPDEMMTVPLNGSPPPAPGLQAGNSFMNSLSGGESHM
jgi:hypothetical protein